MTISADKALQDHGFDRIGVGTVILAKNIAPQFSTTVTERFNYTPSNTTYYVGFADGCAVDPYDGAVYMVMNNHAQTETLLMRRDPITGSETTYNMGSNLIMPYECIQNGGGSFIARNGHVMISYRSYNSTTALDSDLSLWHFVWNGSGFNSPDSATVGHSATANGYWKFGKDGRAYLWDVTAGTLKYLNLVGGSLSSMTQVLTGSYLHFEITNDSMYFFDSTTLYRFSIGSSTVSWSLAHGLNMGQDYYGVSATDAGDVYIATWNYNGSSSAQASTIAKFTDGFSTGSLDWTLTNPGGCNAIRTDYYACIAVADGVYITDQSKDLCFIDKSGKNALFAPFNNVNMLVGKVDDTDVAGMLSTSLMVMRITFERSITGYKVLAV